MGIDPDDIIACFGPYRPDGYTAVAAVANLQEHVADGGFRKDLLDLVAEDAGFDVDRAAGLVTDELLRRL